MRRDSKEELIGRAEKMELAAKQLRLLAHKTYLTDDGCEFAKLENGFLVFIGKSPKLPVAELERFARWAKRVVNV